MGIFGKKKNEKVRTFKDGQEQVPDQVPDLEIPVPLPADQEFKPGQEVELGPDGQYRVVSDCFICHDHLYYQDSRGVWRDCPRCSNPPGTLSSQDKEPDYEDEADQILKPGQCWRHCASCGQSTPVHSSKKEFICPSCDTVNKFEKPKGGQ